MRTPHDVLIIGAGPAGAHTALRLARAGRRVALVDARAFPRPKPCGEFLSPACLPMLDELDLLEPVLAAGAVRVEGMQLATSRSAAGGRYRSLGHYEARPDHGLGIRREVLDLLAVEAAAAQPNVELRTETRMLEPLRDADGRVTGARVQTRGHGPEDLRARFTVGADGRRSRLARALGWGRDERGPRRFALVARYRGVAPRTEAELHVVGHDYFAACPIDDGLFTANLVVDAEDLPKGAAALEQLFRRRLATAPGLAARLAGARLEGHIAACGPLRWSTRRRTGPGVALVGDACGFVDPLTGEGLYFAMEGARLLAGCLDEALARGTAGAERRALARYERARRRELGPRYALARLLQHGLRRPGVPERVVGLLGRRRALGDLLLGLTGDYVPLRGLGSPAVWRSALTPLHPARG